VYIHGRYAKTKRKTVSITWIYKRLNRVSIEV
jgi:hypothetical protein